MLTPATSSLASQCISGRRRRALVERLVRGVGHLWGLAPAADTLRQNSVTLGGDLVLRVDLVGWRLDPEAYLDQVCAAYVQLAGRKAA